jgi:LysM repeat protein
LTSERTFGILWIVARTQVRRRQTAAAGVVLTVAIAVGFIGGRASANQRLGPPTRVYVVQAGDSLWGIARRQVGPAGDPRQVVQQLIERNHVTDGAIAVGERLVLPAH